MQGPPARPGEVLTGFTEPFPTRPGYTLHLRNNLDEPVTVTALILYQCENVLEPCTERDLGLVLEPGEVRRVARVEPADRERRFRYRWRWSYRRGAWGPEESFDEPAPPARTLQESQEATVLLDPRGRFVNLVLPPTTVRRLGSRPWDLEAAAEVSRTLYRSFEDDFDFLMVAFADDEAVPIREGRTVHARNTVEGLGLPVGQRSAEFGSERRLVAVLKLAAHRHLDSQLPLHEIAHLWGQYVLEDTGSDAHWGFSGVGGHLGGWAPGTLEEAGAGTWLARGPGVEAGFTLHGMIGEPRPYAPLELYLMGLLPPDSVPSFERALDAEWLNESLGLFRASGVRTVTVEEIVERHDARSPSYRDAPRSFRGLYAVISSEPLDDALRNRIDRDVAEFARSGPREARRYLNFWEATEGRGTLILEGLTEVVRTDRSDESGAEGAVSRRGPDVRVQPE